MGGRRTNSRIGWLAGGVVVVAVTFVGLPARAAPPAGSPSAPSVRSAAAARVTAEITIQHRGHDRPGIVTIRLHPPYAAGDGELLLSIFERDGRVINRHVLEPVVRGLYRAEFLFPRGGHWGYYMRFGSGQAGYVSSGIVDLTPEPGTVDTFTAAFRSGLGRVPQYVQPVGYAAFGLLAVLAFAGMWAVLAWLRTGRLGRSAG